MNQLSKYFVMIAMTAAVGATAVAAEPGERAGGDGPHMGWHKMSPEKMREHMAKRQAEMHDKLKLTAAQEPAWRTFVAETTPKDMGKHWGEGERREMEKMSAPERMEKHLQMSKEREARMSQHLESLKTFYAVLTPEQQHVFDREMMHGGKHHHGERHDERADQHKG